MDTKTHRPRACALRVPHHAVRMHPRPRVKLDTAVSVKSGHGAWKSAVIFDWQALRIDPFMNRTPHLDFRYLEDPIMAHVPVFERHSRVKIASQLMFWLPACSTENPLTPSESDKESKNGISIRSLAVNLRVITSHPFLVRLTTIGDSLVGVAFSPGNLPTFSIKFKRRF